ncbi:MAG: hypothetical protein V3W28_06060 [Thermoplasmata archaeon]
MSLEDMRGSKDGTVIQDLELQLCQECIKEATVCHDCGAVGWWTWVLKPGDSKAEKRCPQCSTSRTMEMGALFQ